MAKRILKDFEPDVAIGVGGYASGPLLYAASKKGIPIVIQEQNSYAGITNKILSRKADKIFVSYEKMEKFFPEDKIILTGNPVRQDIADNLPGKSAAFSHFELAPDKPVIFIMGGSLGSRTINNSVKAALDNLKEENIQVLWQTGKLYFNKMQSVASEIKNIHPFAFIDDMKYAYAAADIIISRAGALSVSELALVGKPVILVPSPNVAEDHQTQNAMALVEKNAAVMISDNKAGKELIKEAIELSGNEKRKEELSQNINKMAHKNAARKIAEEIIQLIDNGN